MLAILSFPSAITLSNSFFFSLKLYKLNPVTIINKTDKNANHKEAKWLASF